MGMRCAYESSAVYDSPLYMGTIRYIAPIGVLKSGSGPTIGDNGHGVKGGGSVARRTGPRPGRFRVSGFDEGGEPIPATNGGCGEDEEIESEVKVIWVGIEFDDPVGRNDGR